MNDTFYFPARFLSFMTDTAITSLPLFVCMFSLSAADTTNGILNSILLFLLILLTIPTAFMLFQSYLTGKIGGSIGQYIWGLTVMNEDGTHISMKNAFFRTLVGPYISSLMLGLGYIWIFMNDKKQAWHDMASKTIVVQSHPKRVLAGILITGALFLCIGYLITVIVSNITKRTYLYGALFEDIKNEFQKTESIRHIPGREGEI